MIINHSSETAQDSIKDEDFDFIINNNGTLEDLTRIINNQLCPAIAKLQST